MRSADVDLLPSVRKLNAKLLMLPTMKINNERIITKRKSVKKKQTVIMHVVAATYLRLACAVLLPLPGQDIYILPISFFLNHAAGREQCDPSVCGER